MTFIGGEGEGEARGRIGKGGRRNAGKESPQRDENRGVEGSRDQGIKGIRDQEYERNEYTRNAGVWITS